MFDRPIEVLRYRESRDEYGGRSKELVPVASLVAQRTESGGRENLYAGRIVHENEVAFTIRYRTGIEAGMLVRDEQLLLPITSVHEEGRRRLLHLLTTKSDAEDLR